MKILFLAIPFICFLTGCYKYPVPTSTFLDHTGSIDNGFIYLLLVYLFFAIGSYLICNSDKE